MLEHSEAGFLDEPQNRNVGNLEIIIVRKYHQTAILVAHMMILGVASLSAAKTKHHFRISAKESDKPSMRIPHKSPSVTICPHILSQTEPQVGMISVQRHNLTSNPMVVKSLRSSCHFLGSETMAFLYG